MAVINFYKYQGTGNDFVMIDDRDQRFPYNAAESTQFDTRIIARICDRKFGVGADGLILIRDHDEYDFEMIYFNADGSQSLCGNGSRCAVRFANYLGIIQNETCFLAIDGPHEAFIEEDLIHLKMGNVNQVKKMNGHWFIDTGSPHVIKFIEDLEAFDVYEEGKAIRHDQAFAPNGTNVNFVEACSMDELFVRTFERGVENETLSCGTGVTAVSLAASYEKFTSPVKIKTLGGSLQVSFDKIDNQKFENIYLIGPAGMVFEGTIQL
ncbi:diaminopimelate epimerase [Fulvivirgaceae bacterium BMA12]|uniref:Diaminopimelate epimerase n=1 Tax=Agaribacillus aureus TaxID=3051825 RepID=A0ABT8LET5_9BACT|nr:diaminopimelate epimerase [Fulvivirgaceae bacterium BMA12]